MNVLTNLDTHLYIQSIEYMTQAQIFTDSKGYQCYEFIIRNKEAEGLWDEDVCVIFKGVRHYFKIQPFIKTSDMAFTISFRYGKFDHRYYFSLNA